MAAKQQVATFIKYYHTYVNDEVIDVGSFPASDEAFSTGQKNWLGAMGQ